jgi:hypothetical protein
MVAHSIIILPMADPVVWAVVAVAIVVEVLVDLVTMRWLVVDARGWAGRIFAMQGATWIAVVGFDSWLLAHGLAVTGAGELATGLMVVVAEVFLLRLASACPGDGLPLAPLRLTQACTLSIVGNLAGVGTAIGAVSILRWLAGA